jgi:hypothetical protein
VNRASLSFRATWRTRARSLGALVPALSPERVSLATFPSADPLPSTDSAAPPWALFAGFAGTTGSSDFPRSCITGLRLLAFPARPALPSPQAGDRGISRFSRMEIPRMHRFLDPARPADGSRTRRRTVLPSAYCESVGTSTATNFGAR